jgi:hypothetical protein
MSACATPDGLSQYTVMPFGMKFSSFTFQRLMNMISSGLEDCRSHSDDTWKITWRQFAILSNENLDINLGKSELCRACVSFLVYVVGYSELKTIKVQIKTISKLHGGLSVKRADAFCGHC